MKLYRTCLLVFSVLGMLSSPGSAQEQMELPDSTVAPGSILVIGDRFRGQLHIEQGAVLELDEGDIQAIGVSSIAELMQVIAPQTGSSRARGGEPPVFLVNGIRVGSFRELRSYPTEAIVKVEVLPEEVALKLGFPPDRRVVNLILKDNFASREAQLEFEAPDRGGYWRNEQEMTLLKIDKGARLNVNLKATDTSMLTEAERNVIQTPGSVSLGISDEDYARFRSLVADSFQIEGSVNWAKAVIPSGSSFSFNLTGEHNQARQLSGLRDIVTLDPLERRSETDVISSSASFGRRLGAFQLTLTADGNVSDTTTTIDRNASAGFDTARSKVIASANKATLEGSVLKLPAGDLSATFDAGLDWQRIDSSDTRSAGDASFTRRRIDGGANVVIPITERGGAWGAIGTLSANFSLGVEDLSDFGTLSNWTAGLTWSPTSSLTLSATHIANEAAPSLAQLGSPQTVTYNVPIFDFVRGEAVLVAVTQGGNPDLRAERQRDWKLTANWELPFWKDTRISVDYVRNNSRDVTGGFPAITAEIEAAFPDRVTREAAGQITAVDSRWVTFERTHTRRLVFGLTTRGSFGTAQSTAGQDAGSARRTRMSMPGMGGRGDDGRGRYFVNLTHQIELDRTVLIAADGPLLDLLDGDATGDSGLSRYTANLEAGMFRNGKGMRLSGSYSGRSRIEGSGMPGSTDLFFGDLLKVDLRIFADLGRIFGHEQGALKNFRFTLRADNLFDARRRVTDGNGNVPLSYQPNLIDPTGRYLGLELRKMF